MSYQLDRLPQKVLPNNLLVKVVDKNEELSQTTDSGLILAYNEEQKIKSRLTEVEVILVPSCIRTQTGITQVDESITVGSIVYAYHPSLHDEIEVDGVIYYYLRYEDIFAVGGNKND